MRYKTGAVRSAGPRATHPPSAGTQPHSPHPPHPYSSLLRWQGRHATHLRLSCALQTQLAAVTGASRSGSRRGGAPGLRSRLPAAFCSHCKRRAQTVLPRGIRPHLRRRSARRCQWPARCSRCAQPRSALCLATPPHAMRGQLSACAQDLGAPEGRPDAGARAPACVATRRGLGADPQRRSCRASDCASCLSAGRRLVSGALRRATQVCEPGSV